MRYGSKNSRLNYELWHNKQQASSFRNYNSFLLNARGILDLRTHYCIYLDLIWLIVCGLSSHFSLTICS